MGKTGMIFAMTMIVPGQNAVDWVNTEMYPFEHHYMQISAGKMHYADEGEGEVILFVHGTPTWSFLYREHIKYFSQNYRCVAMDHIGFGLSEKPEGYLGTPQEHSQNLVEFIQKLDLKRITLVVHDFGGPIGLSAAMEMPDRISRVISFNTWLWETSEDKGVQKINNLVKGWTGKFLYINMNISPRYLLKQGFSDKENLPKEVHKHYLEPFNEKRNRYALLGLARSLMGSSDWYGTQRMRLHTIQDKPWLILWGTRDQFLDTGYLIKWKEMVPEAMVKELESGHFVQEEATEKSIQEIERFLETN